jgi:serine/threonine protein phosphatase PrpC
MNKIDSYYWQGLHDYCQDYTINSKVNDVEFGVLCDGCTSSTDTDIGARILSHTTKKYIKHEFNDDLFKQIIKESKVKNEYIFGLDNSSLYSTLMVMKHQNNCVNIACFGDGFIIEKYKDGRIIIHEIFNKYNAPYYLIYQIDNLIYQYINEFGNINVVKTIELPKNITLKTDKFNVIDCVGVYKTYNNLDELDLLAICSDGLNSFSKDEVKIDLNEIIDKLFNFKNARSGDFVKRRVKSFKRFNKDFKNFDDCSIVVMNCD